MPGTLVSSRPGRIERSRQLLAPYVLDTFLLSHYPVAWSSRAIKSFSLKTHTAAEIVQVAAEQFLTRGVISGQPNHDSISIRYSGPTRFGIT